MIAKRVRNSLVIIMMVSMAAVLLLVSGCQPKANPVQEQQKYVLKFNHVLAPTEPYHQGFLDWAKRVSERTKGGLTIEVSHSAQLGKEEDIIEQLRMGANIGQNTDSARLGMYVPNIAVLNAPYFVNDIDEVIKLKDLPTVKQWIKELELKFGIKVLSFDWVQGERHMVTNVPIRKPSDLKGLRIRTPGVPVWQESVRALGATPVALPFGEIYTSIQTKALDGAELVYRNVTGAKLHEIAKYMSETKHILLVNFSIVGRAWFDSLPAEYQKILIEENAAAGQATSRKMAADVAVARAELIQHGMTIVTDVDMAAFREAGETAYTVLNLKDARDKIYQELGKKR